ncbi:hypothetical protein PoB_001109100 [Plakobranchus ocellatus]|uniref:Uncharacterized protein n=1 Tax=Plakobranchus ocellatus TaxID=259542 RepID=A0AAV3YMS3_9GAST|nr:hypothetical protein PoB_001109100 [Plakobranchus ocellatus]
MAATGDGSLKVSCSEMDQNDISNIFSNHNTGEASDPSAQQADFTAQDPTPTPEEKVLVFTLLSEMAKLASKWNEKEGGKSGNDITAALIRVPSDFVEQHPEVKEICMRSHSYVPQNRNSILTYALKRFMMTYKHIDRIVQKYSESGQWQIQEVDNAHSIIEKTE